VPPFILYCRNWSCNYVSFQILVISSALALLIASSHPNWVA
jgi:hypothetical protein